jgi:hypothetical protein
VLPTAIATPTTVLPTATPDPAFAAIPERVASTPFPTVAMPEQPPADFGMRFGYGGCTVSRILDTTSQTLTQFDIDGQAVTVTLVLPPTTLQQIYAQLRGINFWGYPERYDTILPNDMMRVMSAPYPRYEFVVTQQGQTKEVIWEAMITKPTTSESDQLRGLVALLQQTINDHPATATLPRLVESCA